jgi:GxxExxY protein
METVETPVTRKWLDNLSYSTFGAAIEVHKKLGPGLLESVYQKCMAYELRQRDISFESNLSVRVRYKEIETDAILRCDFFIEKCLVVELKAVDATRGAAPNLYETTSRSKGNYN